MNIEIHRPNEEQMLLFYKFFMKALKEKQWAFVNAETIIGHVRYSSL